MLRLEKATYLGANAYSFCTNGIAVSETEYHQKVFEGWHCHENHHITFIVEGGNCEQRRGREFEACPGTLLIYHSGEMHRNINTLHPSRNINLEIEDSFLQRYGLSFTSLCDSPGLKFAVLKIYRECRTGDACSLPAIEALLLHAFGSAGPERNTGGIPLWAHQLRCLLHDCWNETWSLQQLAAQVHVHPVTISKYFPRYFSCTLGEYMRRVKVERALPLIKQAERPLTDIAYQCGFSDQSHFIRTFKTVTGFLPKEYRQL